MRPAELPAPSGISKKVEASLSSDASGLRTGLGAGQPTRGAGSPAGVTPKRRILWPDGGLMLDGYVWEVVGRGWLTFEKRAVWVVVDPARLTAELYADRACTERLGAAERGAKL